MCWGCVALDGNVVDCIAWEDCMVDCEAQARPNISRMHIRFMKPVSRKI